jgi:hypothetical protein
MGLLYLFKTFTGMFVMHTPSIPTPADSFHHSNNFRQRSRIKKFFTITFFPQSQYTTGFWWVNLKREHLEDRGAAGKKKKKINLKEVR